MTPWLTIVGVGEDGRTSLCNAALHAIDSAALVIGGARHLELVEPVAGKTLAWPSPLYEAFPQIVAHRGTPVVVLASGDPFYHGVGSLLTQHVDAREMQVYPAASAYTLAASRLGWAGQHCCRISLHGRALERIVPHLHPGRKILALSWDGTTPKKLAELLRARGFGASRLVVLEAMGGAREKITDTRADDFAIQDVDALNTIAIEVIAAPGARIIPFTPGLPDDWFAHDGQITKREIRAVTLSGLRPQHGAPLWDIGAGAGSIAIEWMLSDPSCRAIAIEAEAERAARISHNAHELGVPDLQIIEGQAPGALQGLPKPDAIFIGGGATDAGVIDAALEALQPQGRLVINAVTLESQALLFSLNAEHGGDLIEIAISRVSTVGSFRAMKPALPVLQWSWVKP